MTPCVQTSFNMVLGSVWGCSKVENQYFSPGTLLR
ncbi:hypothetical protein SLEP1_g50540 [Rubroshorea leprosula]|uniref:Uncharacterized protein n=1 Tax=Rubroshorea leprosula TaxID=152421 RepID=A0AAV5M2G0_9ROSI|nr:hypothetical protein SLEP1_g50540 [Rubroshorea leprosula]